MSWAELDGRGDSFTWTTSGYIKDLVDEFKVVVPSSGRKWNPGYKTGYRSYHPGNWEVSAKYWNDVISLCKKHGLTVDTTGNTTQPKSMKHNIFVEYMGLVRTRDGGIYTSSGWVFDGWNAVFTLDVLQDWFNFTLNPGDMPTLFSVLGVDQKLEGLAFDKALKKSYRRAARTWHPDVNKEPEAAETFRTIQEAYEKLQDPLFRKRYKAGMHFQKKVEQGSAIYGSEAIKWRPPIRCGNLKVQATATMGKYAIEKILDWQDVRNNKGETMVTFWSPGSETFSVKWVV